MLWAQGLLMWLVCTMCTYTLLYYFGNAIGRWHASAFRYWTPGNFWHNVNAHGTRVDSGQQMAPDLISQLKDMELTWHHELAPFAWRSAMCLLLPAVSSNHHQVPPPHTLRLVQCWTHLKLCVRGPVHRQYYCSGDERLQAPLHREYLAPRARCFQGTTW